MDVQVKERTPGSRNILFRPFVSAVTAFPRFPRIGLVSLSPRSFQSAPLFHGCTRALVK